MPFIPFDKLSPISVQQPVCILALHGAGFILFFSQPVSEVKDNGSNRESGGYIYMVFNWFLLEKLLFVILRMLVVQSSDVRWSFEK